MAKLKRKVNKQLVISIAIFLFLVTATALVVSYGLGYRFGLGEGRIEFNGTGILVAKSIPDSAQVFVNDDLKTATDNTINLPKGTYHVKIVKEGYFPWEKNIVIQNEVVSKAEALLIPTAPKLENITDLGAQGPIIDPTLTKIAFKVSSQSAERNGIYVFDMARSPLTLQSSSVQIVDDTQDLFSQADISWSPDGKDLMATTSALGVPITYLLDTDRSNNPPNNVTESIITIEDSWARMRTARRRADLASLPSQVRKMATGNFNIISFSPDKNKILYEASHSARLPIIIKPRIIGANSTPEVRNVEQGLHYIYDVKEDRNYKVDSGKIRGAASWFTDNRHLIFVKDNQAHIMEYDGLNDTVVYAGPFDKNYIFPWPDAKRIVLLTNLGNSQTSPNLYTITFD